MCRGILAACAAAYPKLRRAPLHWLRIPGEGAARNPQAQRAAGLLRENIPGGSAWAPTAASEAPARGAAGPREEAPLKNRSDREAERGKPRHVSRRGASQTAQPS
eukprot:GHVT01004534.1.p1 GENE.GHVT01004534.1~~GHVT01004534.1.p1  ORF type:complete len:105 (+),score=27.42 GHVT01004534.1:53-367(+)